MHAPMTAVMLPILMNWRRDLPILFAAFCFGYPFVMSWYWMAGGVLFNWFRERHEPKLEQPPALLAYPMVSILLPCYNEEATVEETIAELILIDYPAYEIIAINDGSRDRTEEILERLIDQVPQLRVVHLTRNQGKAMAMNAGALLARGEFLICIDSDALLDRHAVTWMVRRMQSDGRLGGITGNPRIRNRSTLLGRLQVGEFSAIVGLIKRAQTVFGWLFSVSGVICCFRKRAVQEAGWWSSKTLTDDVDLTWRVQMAGWHITYEPKAICWILMPETLRGLWRQRLRWSEGGTQTVLISIPKFFYRGSNHRWRGSPACVNYVASVIWAYLIVIGLLLYPLSLIGISGPPMLPQFRFLPEWFGIVLAFTYIIQAIVSILIDKQYEPNFGRSLFWVVWYPLIFWTLQAFTAVVGLPRAIFNLRNPKGTWISPDRGLA